MSYRLWASLEAQLVQNLPAMQETPGSEDPLEKGLATPTGVPTPLATHSSILGLPLWLSW